MKDRELTGKVALVTGAGRGVGLGIALELVDRGASVVINDIDRDRATEAVHIVARAGGTAIAATGDITCDESVREVLVEANRLGPVDILVNNAGIPPQGMGLVSFVEEDPQNWRQFIDINVYGVANMCRAALPAMVDRGWGRIITIVSDSARAADGNLAMYAASKAAASTLTRSIAAEVGASGVTCNVISLSTIAHPAMSDELKTKLGGRYPAKRLGEPADVAGAVAYFASPSAAWVTGQTLSVNGGYVRF